MTMDGPSFPDRASLEAQQLERLRELLGVAAAGESLSTPRKLRDTGLDAGSRA